MAGEFEPVTKCRMLENLFELDKHLFCNLFSKIISELKPENDIVRACSSVMKVNIPKRINLNKQPPSSEELAKLKVALDSYKLHVKQKQYSEALPFALRALDFYARYLEPSHEYIMVARRNLGELYFYLGLFDKALPVYRKLLAGMAQKFGANHPDVIERTADIGAIFFTMVDTKKPQSFLQRH